MADELIADRREEFEKEEKELAEEQAHRENRRRDGA
jgi:hypothetical protein